MADHLAIQARDYIASELAGIATIVKSRVFPIQQTALPAIAVDLGECAMEVVAADNSSGVLIQSLQALNLNIYVADTTLDTGVPVDLDAELWRIITQIESTLGADSTINGLIKFSYPSGIQTPEREEAEVPHAKVILEYTLEFYHRANAPDVSS